MADESTVASRALTPGETTSEFKEMQETKQGSKWAFRIGTVVAFLPQLLDMVKWLPEGMQDNKYVLMAVTVLGALIAVIAKIQETITKVSYINGRSLIKAAAVREVPATTPLDEKKAA